MSYRPTPARPRVPSVLSALLLTLAASLALAPGLVAQAQVTGLSETEITVGSTFEITGSGFGTKTPKVFLAQDGVQVKGTTLKVLCSSRSSVKKALDKAGVAVA